jgi:hypothetical protein
MNLLATIGAALRRLRGTVDRGLDNLDDAVYGDEPDRRQPSNARGLTA